MFRIIDKDGNEKYKILSDDILVFPTVQENKEMYPFFGFFNVGTYSENKEASKKQSKTKQTKDKNISNNSSNNIDINKEKIMNNFNNDSDIYTNENDDENIYSNFENTDNLNVYVDENNKDLEEIHNNLDDNISDIYTNKNDDENIYNDLKNESNFNEYTNKDNRELKEMNNSFDNNDETFFKNMQDLSVNDEKIKLDNINEDIISISDIKLADSSSYECEEDNYESIKYNYKDLSYDENTANDIAQNEAIENYFDEIKEILDKDNYTNHFQSNLYDEDSSLESDTILDKYDEDDLDKYKEDVLFGKYSRYMTLKNNELDKSTENELNMLYDGLKKYGFFGKIKSELEEKFFQKYEENQKNKISDDELMEILDNAINEENKDNNEKKDDKKTDEAQINYEVDEDDWL